MRLFNNKLLKDERAFTGLEAAIVLTAFVVVAAVFSYVVLGAGFFTSEKSKEVIHTGVDQATSSAEVVGDIVGINDTTLDGVCDIDYINFTIELTAGNNPLDLSQATIAYTSATVHNSSLTWSYTVFEGDSDNMLEAHEKAEIRATIHGAEDLGTYTEFELEFKPSQGGSLVLAKTTPGAINRITRLY
ncbi:MAG: flagellin [Candidatus Methanogaster sp.]|uniref:Flagellin n=1 Tax=Candidatus Methanogaster sp. TaxID=3386292 RepID=A0AC61L4K9_9EURY|nr:MAG: flagellin [ANME-2 cluster archaeon]